VSDPLVFAILIAMGAIPIAMRLKADALTIARVNQ